MDILLIGDAHSDPKVSNRRFDWLGNLIVDRQPDVIVDIGDWASMDTLGHYDKGMGAAWGKYYKDEVAQCRDANARAFGEPLRKFNRANSKNKKAKYNPRIIRCAGNHDEGRFSKVLNKSPELVGTIGMEDLGYTDYGCEPVPFLKPITISGVTFAHYFYPKTQNYGCTKARQLLLLNHGSSAQGHTHTLDICIDYGIDGRRMTGLIGGYYADPDTPDGFEYAGPQTRWTNGLCWLHDVNEFGEFDFEFIGIERVRKQYG